jgi:hypothetical protein
MTLALRCRKLSGLNSIRDAVGSICLDSSGG